MTENAFTKDLLNADDIVVRSGHLVSYALVHKEMNLGALPAEMVDGRYVVPAAVVDLWIASLRGRTNTVPGLTPEAVAALSGGKETVFSVLRAIELGDLSAEQIQSQLPPAVTDAMDAGEVPGPSDLPTRLSIAPADAAAWLARTAPAGVSVDDVIAASGRKVTHATAYKAIETGALVAERFGDRYIIQPSDAATWIASLPVVTP